jgi:TPR repeat protein
VALRERLRATDEVLASSKVSAPLLAKLLDQPSAHHATVLSVLAGIPIAAMWIVALVFGIGLYRDHGLRLANVLLLSATAMVTIVACYYLLRFWFVNRMALGVITLSFGAFPPATEGAPWTCRSCSAPLPPARDGLLARCAWCGSDNVHGIDLRPRAEGARKDRATLETAFARREKDRRRYALFAAAALAILPLGLWGFFRASGAVTRDAKLMVACDRGELPVCVELGRYYLETQTYNQDAAKRVFDNACKRGSLDACNELGELLGRGDDNEVTRAVDLLWAGCQGGHAASCTSLGLVTTSRSVKRPEIPASIDLFRRACNAKHTRGCTVLAEKMFAGSDTPKDPAGAVKLWEQSCADSDTYACSDLAELYFDGNTVAQDRARAVAMFDKACASSPPTYAACARLGLAYDKGLGVPKNAAKGWDLLRTSCEYGSIASACTRVGEIQESQGHLDRAFDHYARACSANDAGGCIGLASVQVKKGDAAKALGVLRRTCVDQRLGQACALGGIWNANGEHGLAKNATLAAELYARGCELGDGDSCNLGGQFADAQQDYASRARTRVRARRSERL